MKTLPFAARRTKAKRFDPILISSWQQLGQLGKLKIELRIDVPAQTCTQNRDASILRLQKKRRKTHQSYQK